MRWFYDQSERSTWKTAIKEALISLGKNKAVAELGLDKLAREGDTSGNLFAL